jgi:arabinogalactan oligomer/maltooligosaccharide transport system permease protein
MSVSESTRTRTPAQLFSNEKRTTLIGLIVKIVFLGVVASVAIWLIPLLIRFELWVWLAIVVVTVVAIFFIYTTRRYIPGKYIFPGTFFLCLALLVPVGMTINYSFTNFGDGTRGTKEQAINSIIGNSVQMTPDAPIYNLAIGTQGDVATGPFTFFLVEQEDPDGPVQFGSSELPLEPFEGDATVVDGRVTAVEGFTILTPREINAAFEEIQNTAVMVDDTSAIKVQGVNTAFQGRATLQFDEATDTITNLETGDVYRPGKIGNSTFFLDADGNRAFTQSWLENIGWANYQRLFTDRSIANQFVDAFVWTLIFALGSVFLTFIVGYFLAVTLNDSRLKLRRTMRSFLLLPYAVPAFISILIWASFYNRDFGLINDVLGANINWLGNPTLAKIAILITNTWLGFPYMFIVCTGALQSIPDDVIEAAEIDGATGIQRSLRVTMPLLLVSVAPLLVASFAFNFNNFNLIQLLTQGGPFQPGQFTRGSTDILISMVYRIAFGGSGADYGFASAVTVVLFILTGVIATFQFRMTKRLEDFA